MYISLSIIGEWEWTKSQSAWTGEITSPDDVGYHETKVFRNDTLCGEHIYSITYEESTETKSKGTLRIIQGSHPTFIIENNSLVLSLA